jgi:hypothetical protein
MHWGTRARTDIQIPWANFKATNIGFNIAVKKRFFREWVLHLTGFKRADLSDVSLNNYVAMYYQRRATMNDDRIRPGNESYERYVTDSAVEEEIRKRSEELLTDELVAAPMVGGSPRAMVTSLVHNYMNMILRSGQQ